MEWWRIPVRPNKQYFHLVIQARFLFYLQHVEDHPADWPQMESVLPLVGINDSSIDYKKAVDDWLTARDQVTQKS